MALPSRLRAMSWLSCPIDCRGQRKLERRRYRGRDRVRTWGTTLILLPSSSSSESAVLRARHSAATSRIGSNHSHFANLSGQVIELVATERQRREVAEGRGVSADITDASAGIREDMPHVR